ncbi:3437_t:CDS:2, partial [Funneliformis geosporum]
DVGKLKIILPVMFRSPAIVTKYKKLVMAIEFMEYWKTINVDQYCPYSDTGFSELSSSKHRREINVNINEDNEKENNGENLMETDSHNDPIAELFKLVQVNRKHTCSSPIEKPYFVAGIFPQICNVCRILEDLIQVENELPYCRE